MCSFDTAAQFWSRFFLRRLTLLFKTKQNKNVLRSNETCRLAKANNKKRREKKKIHEIYSFDIPLFNTFYRIVYECQKMCCEAKWSRGKTLRNEYFPHCVYETLNRLVSHYFVCFVFFHMCNSLDPTENGTNEETGTEQKKKQELCTNPKNEYIKYLLFIGSSVECRVSSINFILLFLFCCLIFADYQILKVRTSFSGSSSQI